MKQADPGATLAPVWTSPHGEKRKSSYDWPPAAFETSEAIFITDRDGALVRINHAFTQLTGYTAEEAIGQNPRLLKSGQHPPEFYIALWQGLLNRRPLGWRNLEPTQKRRDLSAMGIDYSGAR